MTWPVIEKFLIVSLIAGSGAYIILFLYRSVFSKGRATGCAGCPLEKSCDQTKEKDASVLNADKKGCCNK